MTNINQSKIKAMVVREARALGVPASLALAVAHAESSFNSAAVSRKGARGVMQIMPLTAKKIYGIERYKLFNPIVNIKLGLHFLDHLIQKYRGRVDIALSHYNGGSAVGKWPNVKIIPATYPYVIKVLKNSNKFSEKMPTLTNVRKINFNKVKSSFEKNSDLLLSKLNVANDEIISIFPT